MDPNPTSFPILSYVMARLPHLGSKPASPAFDIEQPDPAQTLNGPPPELPLLSDPNLLAAMTQAVADVAQTRSVLQTLGPRPDHETLDAARNRLAEIESGLAKQLEGVVLSSRPPEVDRFEWRAHLADKEQKLRREAEREGAIYRAVIQLEEMHSQYDKLLKEAEARLVGLYEKAGNGGSEIEAEEEANEEVVGILTAASRGLETVDLSNRRLRFIPEAFGRIPGLRVLNVSSNQLEIIPDSISALEMLEELNLSSNLLEALPDSIGLLHNLRILNVSSNKLESLPDSICHCRSLVELDVSFNRLTYLPTNIGYELVNLKRFSIQLNKIRTLPSSIGQMRSLEYLDAHFNELHGLPISIGKLTNLEILDLSSNFSDLTELPETLGELTNLRELDLSNNQIYALPDTFGRLDNLTKLNLDQNPLVIPPPEVVKEGAEAVKIFMAKRWLDILLEEERRSIQEAQEQSQTGWLTRSKSLLKSYASIMSENVSGYLSPRSPRDPLLDQQL